MKLLQGLHNFVEGDAHSCDTNGWQCDVGPDGVAYTYDRAGCEPGAGYLSADELPDGDE